MILYQILNKTDEKSMNINSDVNRAQIEKMLNESAEHDRKKYENSDLYDQNELDSIHEEIKRFYLCEQK